MTFSETGVFAMEAEITLKSNWFQMRVGWVAESSSAFTIACFLSPPCVCEWRLIALPGVIKGEWTSGFMQWHGSYFMALPSGQWLCCIIVPRHCAAFYGCSCHLSSIQCYPAWEWHFCTAGTSTDKRLTSHLKPLTKQSTVIFLCELC